MTKLLNCFFIFPRINCISRDFDCRSLMRVRSISIWAVESAGPRWPLPISIWKVRTDLWLPPARSKLRQLTCQPTTRRKDQNTLQRSPMFPRDPRRSLPIWAPPPDTAFSALNISTDCHVAVNSTATRVRRLRVAKLADRNGHGRLFPHQPIRAPICGLLRVYQVTKQPLITLSSH